MAGQTARFSGLDARTWWRAVGIGGANAILLSAIMVPAFKAGIAPMPKQPGLAFAETLLHRPLPLPVGLVFHLVYVTFWSMTFVVLARGRQSFRNALWLALALWVLALVVFFPVVGWGFLGLAISPSLIVAALIPHLLFAVFLWAGCRLAFGPTASPAGRER